MSRVISWNSAFGVSDRQARDRGHIPRRLSIRTSLPLLSVPFPMGVTGHRSMGRTGIRVASERALFTTWTCEVLPPLATGPRG